MLGLDPGRNDGHDLGDMVRDAAGDGEDGLVSARRLLERMAQDAPQEFRAHDRDERPASSEWPTLAVRGLPAFPVDAFPSAVATWARATAEHTQTPVDLAALAALGVLSAAAIGSGV